MTTTRNTKRTSTQKLAARTAAATLSLVGLAALAGPAGANVVNDQTPPEYNPTFSSLANADGWHKEAVTIEWNWSDDESGIGTDCDHSSSTTNEGFNFVVASCTNGSGLTATPELLLQVDSVPPTATLDPVADGGTTLHFSATDETSGVDHFICSLGDDAPTERCESPIDLSALPAGYNDIAIQAVDKASNISERAYFTHVVFPDLPSGSTYVDGVRITKKRNGDVTLAGTSGDDSFHLKPGQEPGHLAISRNGDSFDDLIWAGPVRNLIVSTKAGNDVVTFENQTRVPGNLNINLGQGFGSVFINETTVEGRTSVRLGSNRDGVVSNVSIGSSDLQGPLTLIGGATDDSFYVDDTRISGKLSIRAGVGDNKADLSRLEGLSRIEYRGGSGRDQFRTWQVDFGGRSSIKTDGGDDVIEAFGMVDGLSVHSGRGNDTVQVGAYRPGTGDAQTDHVVRVIAGPGDDSVSAGEELGEASSFDGSSGQDDYIGPESFGVRNFERINPGS